MNTPALARRLAFLFLAAAGLASVTAPAHATFIREYAIPELWSLADCVVEGHVDSVTYGLHPVNGAIVTHIHLNVTMVHQGPCAPGPRVITQAGGRLGGMGLAIARMPSFTTGEQVLLFLDEFPGMLFPVLALDQGKFTIVFDAQAGREILTNPVHRALDRNTLFHQLRPARGTR